MAGFASPLAAIRMRIGALNLTIQKFYRVAGAPHSFTAWLPTFLPSLSDLPEFGEGALKNAMPYDEVAKRDTRMVRTAILVYRSTDGVCSEDKRR